MITVNKLIEKLLEFQKQGYGEFPCIYAKDAEGNGYKTVQYEAELKEVENLDDYDLEIVWDEDGETQGENYNCIIIN